MNKDEAIKDVRAQLDDATTLTYLIDWPLLHEDEINSARNAMEQLKNKLQELFDKG